MTRAHVGLGSNLGDRMAILDTAVRVLDADEQTHVMAVSRVYETAPVGGPEQDPYLNAVAVLETDRSPYELLETVAEDVAQLVLADDRVHQVRVRVAKPQAPLPVDATVAVEITRDREATGEGRA
ncbi:MAG TPA: 2-amino-4-hydroxy-6-hydroxymethyldihydropteridine diphosphokinase [Actinomycetes bacterium]|nr:2-amino-4-hydroxy-6-hydroxymethyldihydropteridine diphosphokinase [Actinomycetes bacterium]